MHFPGSSVPEAASKSKIKVVAPEVGAFRGPIEKFPFFESIKTQLKGWGVKTTKNTRLLIKEEAGGLYWWGKKEITIGKHTRVSDFFHEIVHFKDHRNLRFRLPTEVEALKSELNAYKFELKNKNLFGFESHEVKFIKNKIKKISTDLVRIGEKT